MNPESQEKNISPQTSKHTDTVSQKNPEKKQIAHKSLVRELVEFVIIAVVIVIPFRMFIAQPFVVNGASMDPTFHDTEYLIVDQISYRFETPARGSVLIFKYPKNETKYFIKRVIGLPGETVQIKDGVVTIINAENKAGFVLDEPYVVFSKKDNSEITLDTGEYFVMGDNRLGSADSRYWGPVPTKDIVGRPILRLFPISTASVFPGDKRALFTK